MRQAASQRNHAYAHSQPKDLRSCLLEAEAFLQLGNQICQRDIDETAANHD